MPTPLNDYNDWTLDTPLLYVTGPGEMTNDAALLNYNLVNRMLRGNEGKRLLQGGQYISDVSMNDTGDTGGWAHPDAVITRTQPQSQAQTKEPWRNYRDWMVWNRITDGLNKIGSASTEAGRAYARKDFRKSLEKKMWTNSYNKWELACMAVAHGESATMEDFAAANPKPNSILKYVTEDTTNKVPNGFTTVGQRNPATDPSWMNEVGRYNRTDLSDANEAGTGLVDVMEDTCTGVKFNPPSTNSEYFDNITKYRQVVATSRAGLKQWKSVTRNGVDRYLGGGMDPANPNPVTGGIPIIHVVGLDTAANYYNGSTYVTENATSLTDGGAWSTSNWRRGPRYYVLNFNFIAMVMQEDGAFELEKKVRNPDNQPNVFSQDVIVDGNVFCWSRKRQAVVGPGGT